MIQGGRILWCCTNCTTHDTKILHCISHTIISTTWKYKYAGQNPGLTGLGNFMQCICFIISPIDRKLCWSCYKSSHGVISLPWITVPDNCGTHPISLHVCICYRNWRLAPDSTSICNVCNSLFHVMYVPWAAIGHAPNLQRLIKRWIPIHLNCVWESHFGGKISVFRLIC